MADRKMQQQGIICENRNLRCITTPSSKYWLPIMSHEIIARRAWVTRVNSTCVRRYQVNMTALNPSFPKKICSKSTIVILTQDWYLFKVIKKDVRHYCCICCLCYWLWARYKYCSGTFNFDFGRTFSGWYIHFRKIILNHKYIDRGRISRWWS